MFEDKNKKNVPIDFAQGKELKPENISVHTMHKDLDELKHPEKSVLAPSSEVLAPSAKSREGFSEVQKTSPFLAQNIETRPVAQETPHSKVNAGVTAIEVLVSKGSFPEKKKEVSAVSKKEESKKASVGKFIAAIIIVLLIILVGAGGYYFWTTRQNEPVAVIPPTPEPTPQPEPVPAQKFTLDKPNLLQVDISASSSTAIIETLSINIEEIKKESISAPIEFTIVDKENNPIGFSVFSKKFGITFSNNVLASLKDSFSLFVYKDNENYRLGLIVDYKNGVDLKKLMRAEEPRLMTGLTPIFLDIQYMSAKNIQFSDNSYGDLPVRFENIVSPEYLSIDYAVSDKKLFIGTTKATARAIIDYSNAQTAKNEMTQSPQQSEQPVDNLPKTP